LLQLIVVKGATILAALYMQVWRDLALVYASQQQSSDAQLCVQKMQLLEPHSAASYHSVGSVAAACKDAVAAKQAYKSALALDATYAPALLSLGGLQCGYWGAWCGC
jgi:Tfp pilus assembly protein PilF